MAKKTTGPRPVEGEVLSELRAMHARLNDKKVALAEADMAVANAESLRAHARVEVQRETLELVSLINRRAREHGVPEETGWSFDFASGSFKRGN